MGSRKYFGLTVFLILILLMVFVSYTAILKPKIIAVEEMTSTLANTQQIYDEKRKQRDVILQKIAKLKQSVMSSQKKIYTPVEDYGDDKNDTLFFTLYSDVMEMLHANSIKIKSIDYKYNPEEDVFTKQGGLYFVCDINMDLVSNYVNLGKLIQDIYQYPYYIKINSVDVKPYPKDKKILLTKLCLRLYAHTDTESAFADTGTEGADAGALNGAESPLPQQ